MIIRAYDAWVLARVVSAQPVDGAMLGGMDGEWRRVAERLLGSSVGGRAMLLGGFLLAIEDPGPIGQAIDLADPMGPAPDRDAPSEGPPLRVRLTCLGDVQERPIDWLWPGRVPMGMLSLWAGVPKLGKSFVSLDLAASVSRGAAMPGAPPPEGPGDVVLLSAEDDLSRTILPRLRAAGAVRERVHAIESVFLDDGYEGLPSIKTDLEKIEEAVESLPDCRLVIIDPISAYLTGVDDHRNSELRGVLSPLKAMAERRNIAVVILTHLSKGGKAGPSGAQNRVIGSIAYVGACRANSLFVRDATDPDRRRVLMADLGGNIAEPAPTLGYTIGDPGTGEGARVCWIDEPFDVTADEAMEAERPRGEKGADSAPERSEAEQWLREALSAGPVATQEIKEAARSAGLSWTAVERVKRDIGAVAFKQGFGLESRWHWRLGAAVA